MPSSSTSRCVTSRANARTRAPRSRRPARGRRRRARPRSRRCARGRAPRCWSRRARARRRRRPPRRARRKPLRAGVVVGEPLDVVVERVEARGSEDADLAHSAAVALAPHAGRGDAARRCRRAPSRRERRAPWTGTPRPCRRPRRTTTAARRSPRARSTVGHRRGGPRARSRRPARAAPAAVRAAARCRRRSCACSRPRSRSSTRGSGPESGRMKVADDVDVDERRGASPRCGS